MRPMEKCVVGVVVAWIVLMTEIYTRGVDWESQSTCSYIIINRIAGGWYLLPTTSVSNIIIIFICLILWYRLPW